MEQERAGTRHGWTRRGLEQERAETVKAGAGEGKVNMELKFGLILLCFTVHMVVALKEEASVVTEKVIEGTEPAITEEDVVVEEPFIKLALELFKTLPKPLSRKKLESLKAGITEGEDTTNEKVRFRPKTTYSSHLLPYSQVRFVWMS